MVSTPAASSEDTNNLRFMEHLPLGSSPERDPNVLPKLEHHFKGGGLPCQCHVCLPKQTMVLTLGSIVGKPPRSRSTGSGAERKESIRSGGSAGRFQANFKNAGGDERCCAVALRSRESPHTRGRHGTRRFPISTRRAGRTEGGATLPISLRRMCGPSPPGSRIDTRERDL